ncbi:hypothetical protein HPB52_000750 [Rhipicephalus sanguineus]|uniref:Uncharacterized protein n=1 Tax=Rhipicephalus sanguineus TaxID=34632 RepID=A0A9D4PHB0_RHISA|nr:hypothetical protein HPB52_000750 [Rhipicephalus sanguineus]
MEASAGLKDGDVRAENEALKLELERCHRKLAQYNQKMIQSAQYGLDLLAEKEALQQRCDTTKHEMEILKEALAKAQTSQKVSTTTGIEQEESLLQEFATKEASFSSSLQELKKELKKMGIF